jgi:hypothetical protein
MAKRAKRTTSEPERERTEDRHTSPFMIRLDEVYRHQLKKWQDQQEQETRFRPAMVDAIRIALEDFLASSGFWPPAEGK